MYDVNGNPKVMWQLEKEGKGVQNRDLTKYLKKAGKYLDPELFTFITYDQWDEKVKAGWREGYNYVTGEKYNIGLSGLLSTGQMIEDGYHWVYESELGGALMVLGFSYASYRMSTQNGVKKIITDGSHLEDGILKSNSNYKAGENDYLYRTDGVGRISVATTDNLQLKYHKGRLPHNPSTTDKLVDDHAGHLFADRLGGSPELDNPVSQAKKVNLSEYKKLENTWAKALERGEKVTVDIKINYPTSSSRPESFEVKYIINGIPSFKKINN